MPLNKWKMVIGFEWQNVYHESEEMEKRIIWASALCVSNL